MNAEQLQLGINRLGKRVDAVRKFEPTSVRERFKSPELTALRAFVEEGLTSTFGADSLDYNRYRLAADFYEGPISMGGGGIPPSNEFTPTSPTPRRSPSPCLSRRSRDSRNA